MQSTKKLQTNLNTIGDTAYSKYKKTKAFEDGWLAVHAYKTLLKAKALEIIKKQL